MPGTTSAPISSTDRQTPTGVRDDVDLDRTVWFGDGIAYHSDADWGPACPDKVGTANEHTLADAVDEDLRPCKICEPVDYRRLATDGGQKYTPLQHFAAAISGKLCLDARAVPELDAISIYATQAALRDNRDRLRDEGYRAELDVEHEPTRLLVFPNDDDLRAVLDALEDGVPAPGESLQVKDPVDRDDQEGVAAPTVVPDGGVQNTPDELDAHDHANDLEAALDFVMEATRRADEFDVDDVGAARLGLAESGAREAFYTTSEAWREMILDDTFRHLEAAVDAIDHVDVTHPTREALQRYIAREERLVETEPTTAPSTSSYSGVATSTPDPFGMIKRTISGTLAILSGVFAGASISKADFVETVETSSGTVISTSAPGEAFWFGVALMTVATMLVAYTATGGRR